MKKHFYDGLYTLPVHGAQTKAVLTLPVAQSKLILIGIEILFKNLMAKFRLEKLKNNCM